MGANRRKYCRVSFVWENSASSDQIQTVAIYNGEPAGVIYELFVSFASGSVEPLSHSDKHCGRGLLLTHRCLDS